jgi:hypothetical protein
MKRAMYAMLATLLALLACGTPIPSTTTPTNPPTISLPPAANGKFTISVEYAILGVASTYASAGITYAKLQNVFAVWGNLQPEAGGSYDWGPLDALVREYQQAGFSGLQMDLAALSPWASAVQPSLGNLGDAFPKDEYLNDYAAFVKAVVERYDGDNMDDMPGLLYPIHDYGVEREFSGFWPGSAQEYVRLLEIAYPAIKAADPDAQVLLVALLMADIFDGDPSPAEIERRLTVQAEFMRKSVPDIRTILAACDSYDIVDFHSLGNYTEIPLTAEWIRSELVANGCGARPIWIGDAFPMSTLVGYGGFVPATPFAPATLESREAVIAALRSVADPSDLQHDSAQAWLYAETAIGLVRKVVVSGGEGLLGINVGNMEDWKTGLAAADKASVPMLGASMFMGLTDTTITPQKPGGNLPYTGQDWSKIRSAGVRRPAWYALELVEEKIGAFTSVSKLDLGADIWAYRFGTPSGAVWVVWYDDGKLYLPGETPPSMLVNLPFDAPTARLTLTPTVISQSEPAIQELVASNGTLSLTAGETPVFIEIQP